MILIEWNDDKLKKRDVWQRFACTKGIGLIQNVYFYIRMYGGLSLAGDIVGCCTIRIKIKQDQMDLYTDATRIIVDALGETNIISHRWCMHMTGTFDQKIDVQALRAQHPSEFIPEKDHISLTTYIPRLYPSPLGTFGQDYFRIEPDGKFHTSMMEAKTMHEVKHFKKSVQTIIETMHNLLTPVDAWSKVSASCNTEKQCTSIVSDMSDMVI